MFRNPRPATSPAVEGTALLPSTGRPPTPPMASHSSPMAAALVSQPPVTSTTSLLAEAKGFPRRTPSMAAAKSKGKSNGNIMNFFKKADLSNAQGPNIKNEEESLFFESNLESRRITSQTPTPPLNPYRVSSNERLGSTGPESPSSLYNEVDIPPKRRKLDVPADVFTRPEIEAFPASTTGPFLDDSDDENADSISKTTLPTPTNLKEPSPHNDDKILDRELAGKDLVSTSPPPLKREATSVAEVDVFEGIEDFIDDEFATEGEEFMERRWMEEQAELELGLEQDDNESDDCMEKMEDVERDVQPEEAGSLCCPICGGATTGLSEQQMSIHVNDCLDGKAKPLSQMRSPTKEGSNPSADSPIPTHKRFNKAAVARPGQEIPFSLIGNQSSRSSSAFSKIMSGHAEDNAWAAAAASEAASRGKLAYQRTCPFYKIMPGFFICVDAFRYGAVQGCHAYFLSHFHSDHYIGLTSSWCHGPIYCSRVTGNLVRRQLRVDPKWVIDLEFEKKAEVPNTQGVEVTMIPANHCPGSSLFLFEKTIGRGKSPKIQRVLHCGDFRACPAHVQHAKLRPDILDSITGRTIGQQKIDVCYLDTTYLTPKYAFPPQEDVIRACGDMCVSLSKDFVDEEDGWEQTKKERAGAGMVKFVRKASIKEEGASENDEKTESENSIPKRSRGRLLVIVGTYSIGKERICLGVARALNSKIYAPPNKQKVVAALEDPELSARMTDDPLEAQVHMQMLMEIRAETLGDYLTSYKPHFSRIVGFRPSGWNYRPPNSRFTESPSVQTVLHSENWKSRYSMAELAPQRGSTREASCFGVPYSEHSSFRELTMFCCALRIDKIIPTVNVGSAKSREKMKAWCEKWAMEKKKNGLYKLESDRVAW